MFKMEPLRNRLAAEKQRLSYLSDQANEITGGDAVNKIKCSLSEVWDKIVGLLNSFAEVATCEEFEEVLEDINGLELIYVSAKTRLTASLEPDEDVQLDLSNYKVTLPTFKGGYLSWIKFRRIFRSFVVENNALDNTKKLNILKSLVAGYPLSIIQHQENFNVCWTLLNLTYHNRSEIANALAKETLELPKLYHNHKNEDDVINAFKEIYAGFIELNMFDLWDVLTTNILTKNIKEDVVSCWRATLQDGIIPTLDNLLQFLDHHVFINSYFGRKSEADNDNCTNSTIV